MRIAIVHDWLFRLTGAERVLLELHRLFPRAPIYTLFADKKFVKNFLPDARVVTSWAQHIPGVVRLAALTSPLLASACESFDLGEYDLVLSSSAFFSKGVILRPHTMHICYCYSPTRQLWDNAHGYGGKNIFVKGAQHMLRIWDIEAAQRPNHYLAVSQVAQQRIRTYYRRDAVVVHPPVSEKFLSAGREDTVTQNYFLVVSRLYAYKNIAQTIEAFNKLCLPLVIVGSGPEYRRSRSAALAHITFLGDITDEKLVNMYRGARALIFPQEEDFGLTCLEAMSFGKPILALRRGGALETVSEGISGEFFEDAIPEAIADGVKRLEANYASYDPKKIKEFVKKFSPERFRKEIQTHIRQYILEK